MIDLEHSAKLSMRTRERFSAFIPFNYVSMIVQSLNGCRSILDIGCGKGEIMMSIKRRINAYTVGLELYLPNLIEAKKMRSHNDFILADARWLPIKSRIFDGVLCSQIVEHVTETEGLDIMDDIERISKLRVVIGTTVGYTPYLPLDPENDNNPFQIHKSGLSKETFISRGYHVRFQGLKLAYGLQGFMRRVPKPLRLWLGLICYLLSPIVCFASSLAFIQVAWKAIQ